MPRSIGTQKRILSNRESFPDHWSSSKLYDNGCSTRASHFPDHWALYKLYNVGCPKSLQQQLLQQRPTRARDMRCSPVLKANPGPDRQIELGKLKLSKNLQVPLDSRQPTACVLGGCQKNNCGSTSKNFKLFMLSRSKKEGSFFFRTLPKAPPSPSPSQAYLEKGIGPDFPQRLPTQT